MRNAIVFSILMFIACEPQVILLTSGKDAGMSTGVGANGTGGARAASSTTASLAASASVMRHLPGTAITTATGKYIYLVQSDGTIAPFASAAVAIASGYPTVMVVTVSSVELNCYGRGDQITVAMPAPASGKLRDGTLVKEKGKTDVYTVSDGVAWPIINGDVFVEAGYDWDNVVEIAAGSLAGKVEAMGNCVAGIACLDEAYLLTCAQDEAIDPLPPPTPTATAISTGSALTTPTATAISTGTATSVPTTGNQRPATNTTRHLPGTAITTATGKYIYLVQSDGTAAPFASAALVVASGYPMAMVITVSATELYCYGRGDQITAAMPAPAVGKLRDGTLVKEKGKTDIYAVSDGVAWPIITGAVFEEAGYDWDNVVELAAGSLAGKVEAMGNCVSGASCLDDAYLMSCAQDAIAGEFSTSAETSTNTAVATETIMSSSATSVATSSATSVVTASAIASETSVATVTTTSVATAPPISSATSIATATANTQTTTATTTTAPPTNTHTASATAVATSAPTVSETATATTVIVTVPTASTTVTNTVTATAFSPDAGVPDAGSPDAAIDSQPPPTEASSPPSIDLSWVWSDGGAALCLNAAYFAGDDKAVLLIWSGPGADAAKGPVAIETDGRFCWDFAGKGKGLYYFWADVPAASCAADICARDTIDGNGAMYMTAPRATPSARKWLHCEPTGCDGAAYWDGSGFTPMGD